jgi:hypothetical protein
MSVETTLHFMKSYLQNTANKRSKIYLTAKDLKVIQNGIYNIYFNDKMNLSESDIKYFRRYTSKLNILASKKSTISVKRDIASNNVGVLRRVANIIITYISE